MIACAVAALVGLVALPGSASATFPGRNGRIMIEYVKGQGFGFVDPETGKYLGRALPPRRLLPAVGASFSPDGRMIAFVRGGEDFDLSLPYQDVWLMNADGSGARRLIRDARSAAWSPDGSRLVVSRGESALWVVRADGSHAKLVPGVRATGGIWSRDGQRILYDGGLQFGRPGTLYSVRPNGEDVQAELQRAPGPLSPDGRTIATVDGDAIVAVSVADGTRRALVSASDPANVSLKPGPWSPDSRELAYEEVTRSSSPGSLFPTVTLFRVTLATGEKSLIGGAGLGAVDWQARCTLAGSRRANRLRGTAGADLLCGLGGNDRIVGGAGSDRLFGERGDDWIDARDAGFDVVGCGPGRDTVLADRQDLVGVDCERVSRS